MQILWAGADNENERNTTFHRVAVPALILENTGRHHNIVTSVMGLLNGKKDPEFQAEIDHSDVIVIERLLLAELQPYIQGWRASGKRVIATFDDAYHLLPPAGLDSFNTWRGGKDRAVGTRSDGSQKVGAILGEFRATLRMVDTALVPSRVLADDYRAYCPTIQYVPNILYQPSWETLKVRPPDNNLIVGWGGSSAHSISFVDSGIIPALGRLCKEFPRLHVHLQTHDPKILVLMDKFGVRYTSGLWVAFHAWPQIVKTFDIGIAPLAGNYDMRRSSLKALEYGMAGIPWVASNGPPYLDARGGILVQNKAGLWYNALLELVKDPIRRDILGSEGQHWAQEMYAGAAQMYEQALGLK
jgi:hypothetical protein